MKIKSEITTEQREVGTLLVFIVTFILALYFFRDSFAALWNDFDSDPGGLPLISGLGTIFFMAGTFFFCVVSPAGLMANAYYQISNAVGEGIHRRKTLAKS